MINLYDLEEDLPGRGFCPIYGIGDGTNADSAINDLESVTDCAANLGVLLV